MNFSATRAQMMGKYIVRTGATVRETAAVFRVSKSTVHKDVTQKLQESDFGLYQKVAAVLRVNKEQRHIRGGEATRQKYLKRSQKQGGKK
ncbi:MAG: sporulation transcriptional regulator SpoIIID [Oscillospiraceae bacterium]|nr:sporulation transcriptional regulator SpoIIID [Candidatus Equicaccousia limihippi]